MLVCAARDTSEELQQIHRSERTYHDCSFRGSRRTFSIVSDVALNTGEYLSLLLPLGRQKVRLSCGLRSGLDSGLISLLVSLLLMLLAGNVHPIDRLRWSWGRLLSKLRSSA